MAGRFSGSSNRNANVCPTETIVRMGPTPGRRERGPLCPPRWIGIGRQVFRWAAGQPCSTLSASGRSRTTNFPICRNPQPANGTAPCIGCWSRFHIRQSRDHRRHGPVGPWTDRLETYRTDGGRASCRTRPPAEALRRIFQFVEIRNRSTELHLASAAGRGSTSGSRASIDTTGQLALGPTGWKPIVRTAAEHGLGAGRPVQTSTKVAPRGGGPSSRPARRLTAWPAAVDPASDDARGTADRFDRAVSESEVPCPMKAEGLRRTSPSE